MARALAVVLILVAVTFTAPALAYRPFDGTDADVADVGEFELELGPAHWYSQGPNHYVIAPATVLNLGFATGWELVGDFKNFVGLHDMPGEERVRLLDTDLFAKGVLLRGALQDDGSGPSIAAELGPLLPNVHGDDGFGAACNLIVSERRSWMTAHLNDQASLTRGDLHFDWFTSLIVEGPFDRPARPVAELFYEHEFVAGLDTYSVLVGGIWRARDGLDFDVGLREASVAGMRATEVRLGLTWAVAVWDGRGESRIARGAHRRFAFAR